MFTWLASLLVVTAFVIGILVGKASVADRTLPPGSTTHCPTESSCKYDYYDKQPHVLSTGN